MALQLSGHLRGLCDSATNFEPLSQVVAACRLRAQCDLFVHTWDELHARTPAWHTWYPTDVPNGGVSSDDCIRQLKQKLKPVSVAVEQQVARRPINDTWIVYSGRHRETHVSLAGLESAFYATAAVSKLRMAYENAERVPPYDVAVRLRPDIYHRRNFRRSRRSDYRGVPMNQICTVPEGAWPAIVRAANSGRCTACVHGCDDETVPGNKSGDMCFWSSPPRALDRLVKAWVDVAGEYLDANLCWQRVRQRRQLLHRQATARIRHGRPTSSAAGVAWAVHHEQGGVAMGGPQTCPHPETQWEGSAAELILTAAATRERLRREVLHGSEITSDFLSRTAKCT